MLNVDIPTRLELESLIQTKHQDSISIYLQTTRLTQATQADRIELKNLVREARRQIEELQEHKNSIGSIEASISDLIADDEFWAHQSNSLAIFATADRLRVFRLPNRLENLVVVSDRFHLTPLLRVMTFPHNAFLLVLTGHGARLIEINADEPHELQVSGLPKSTGTADRRSNADARAHNAKCARAVDVVIRPILAGHQRPLILAGTESLMDAFRIVCSYSHLADETIRGHSESMSDAVLVDASQSILKSIYASDVQALKKKFYALAAEGRATSDLATAARAATYGAVDTLIVDMSTMIPGTVDQVGTITVSNHANATNYGVMDEITRRAVASGAKIVSGRAEDVPGGGTLAAILRYPV